MRNLVIQRTILGVVFITAGFLAVSEPGLATTGPFLETGHTGFKTERTLNNQLTGGIFECRDVKGRRVFADSTAQLNDCQPLQLQKEGNEGSTLTGASSTAPSSRKRPLNDSWQTGGSPSPSFGSRPDFPEGEIAPPDVEGSFFPEDPYSDPSGMPSDAPFVFSDDDSGFPAPPIPNDPSINLDGFGDQSNSSLQATSPETGIFPFGLSPISEEDKSEEGSTAESPVSITAPAGSSEMNHRENQLETEATGSKSGNSERMESCAVSGEASFSSTDFQVIRHPETERITKTVFGGITDFRQYDESGCMQTYSVQVDGKEIYSIQYNARDDHGRITELSETLEGIMTTKVFSYDEQGQLTDVTQNGSTTTYQYDAGGKRLRYEGREGTFLAGYDSSDPFRLVTYGDITYRYHANGAVKSLTIPQGSTHYSYDDEGNLTVTTEDGSKIGYQMKPEDNSVEKTRNGVLVKSFKYENNRLVSEWDDQGLLINEFSYVTQGKAPDYLIHDGQRFRIILDHVGSPRLVINATTGETVQHLDYDPFGKVLRDTNKGFQPLGYAGGLYDQEINLVQLEGRWYDPHPARWINPDQSLLDAGTVNPYVFKNNDPINKVIRIEPTPSSEN